jgi:WW domain-containing oxidoreductase
MNPVLAFTLKLMSPLGLKSVPQGAATETFVATHPSLGKANGEYFADCNLAQCSKLGSDAGLAERLWNKTESLVAGFH